MDAENAVHDTIQCVNSRKHGYCAKIQCVHSHKHGHYAKIQRIHSRTHDHYAKIQCVHSRKHGHYAKSPKKTLHYSIVWRGACYRVDKSPSISPLFPPSWRVWLWPACFSLLCEFCFCILLLMYLKTEQYVVIVGFSGAIIHFIFHYLLVRTLHSSTSHFKWHNF